MIVVCGTRTYRILYIYMGGVLYYMLVPISDFNTAVPPFLSSPFFLFSSPFLFLFFFLLLVAPEKNRPENSLVVSFKLCETWSK